MTPTNAVGVAGKPSNSSRVYETVREGGVSEVGYDLITARNQDGVSVKGVAMNTATNEAYGVITVEQEPEAVYETIDGPLRGLPESTNRENVYEMPSLPHHHHHKPLTTPLSVPGLRLVRECQ